MTTGVELYEALKPTVGEEAARMIVEALPMEEKVATRTDIENLRVATKTDIDNLRAATRTDIDNLRVATRTDIENLRVATKTDIDNLRAATKKEFESVARKEDLHAMAAQIYQRMLTFNITLFLGLAGMIVAIVLKS